MPPNFLFGSYKQYRADTDAITIWLANTARQCGYSSDVLDNQKSASHHTSKLEGRAQKLSRDAIDQTGKPRTASGGSEAATTAPPPLDQSTH